MQNDIEDVENAEKDNSILLYGHKQNASITALSFQPKSNLLVI